MSVRASLDLEWTSAAVAACERLMHPSVTGAQERARQIRLVGVLSAAPFLIAATGSMLLFPVFGVAWTLAAASAAFGFFWMLAAIVLGTGKRKLVEIAGLTAGGAAIASLIAVAGGPSSPLTVLSAALVLEAFFVARTRTAVMSGIAFAACTVAIGAALAMPGTGSLPVAVHWIAPLLYAATLAARLPFASRAVADEAVEPGEGFLEERMDALVLHLMKSGDVTQASHQASELLKVRPDILLGTGFFDRIHVGDRVAYLCALSDMGKGAGLRKVSLRLRMPVEDGATGLAGYRQFGVELVSGADTGTVIAIIRDEREKAELEERIANTRQTMREAEVESKRVMAAVSHELRTPLNAILGFSDTLLTEIFGTFNDERQREYVKLIHEAGGHLLSVVNAMLDVSKVESGTYVLYPEAFRFAEAVEASLALTAQQARERFISVKVDIADDVGVVFCDKRAVQQVLINLVSNAVKFTPDQGEVTIHAKRVDDRIDFSVSDTGIGMCEQDLERVGEPFVQVRSEANRHLEGTGLGLALVKGLVALQGGGLTIDSAPGEGTRVSVSLPVTGSGKKDETNRTDGPEGENEWRNENFRKTA
ncbi:PAS domain-containing sensor histidine kinase [Nitratireductor indicus]|nr:PAS domain-containing sensor histidine kinase [Nitratireductor indicus]